MYLSGNSYIGKDLIIGHGDFKYKVNADWGNLDPQSNPVNDCHEMVQDSKGRIILLTNNIKNNVIIYNKDGKLIDTWGNTYPGAHGLTIKNEGGEDFLYITDTEKSLIVKTTMTGEEVLKITRPREFDTQDDQLNFVPTETAIAENGDIYVADGYGSQYIYIYDQSGKLKSRFGGPGDNEDQFHNCHGVAIDDRQGKSRILVTAREKNQLKHFSTSGQYESSIDLPGAYICRPVIKGENVYLATIWSGDKGNNTGFISILDKDNKLVSAPGGIIPNYRGKKLERMLQAYQVFKHPHDVCVDEDENLYVPQWNSGQVYPMKLIRV